MRGLGEKFRTTLREATKNKLDPMSKAIFQHHLKEFRKKEKQKCQVTQLK